MSSSPARKQRGGQRKPSDEHGSLLVPESAWVVSGRQHHRLRILVLMCRDGKLEESFLKRRAVRSLAARRNYQAALGKFLKCVKVRALHLVEDVEVKNARVAYPSSSISPWFTASCCSDGSLAVIQPSWVQQTADE